MSLNLYDQGSVVRMAGSFANGAGTPTDPTFVQLSYELPDLSEVVLVYGIDAQIVRSATGVYYADIAVNQAGNWRYRWYGEGGIQAANDELFCVRGSPLA